MVLARHSYFQQPHSRGFGSRKSKRICTLPECVAIKTHTMSTLTNLNHFNPIQNTHFNGIHHCLVNAIYCGSKCSPSIFTTEHARSPHLVTGAPALHRTPSSAHIPQKIRLDVARCGPLDQARLEAHLHLGVAGDDLDIDSKSCHVHWYVPVRQQIPRNNHNRYRGH